MFCSYRGNLGVRLIPMIICAVQYNIRISSLPVIVDAHIFFNWKKCHFQNWFLHLVLIRFEISYSKTYLNIKSSFLKHHLLRLSLCPKLNICHKQTLPRLRLFYICSYISYTWLGSHVKRWNIQKRYSNFGWSLWHYVVRHSGSSSSESAYNTYNNVS